jgi:hypothetical protein
MVDTLLRHFGLLLLAAVGAVALWDEFGVAGVIAWWVVLGVAALMFDYPGMGSHRRNG